MKPKIISVILIVAAIGAGATWLAMRHPHAQTASAPAGHRKILYYQSAMHPWIKSDKPGVCPICGMNLVPVYADENGTAGSNPAAAAAGERKIKYYQSTMNPRETNSTPAKDSMGMDMTPVYDDNAGSGLEKNWIPLNADSVSAINVQTAPVERRALVRTLRVAGAIEMDGHPTWFVFNAYERDLTWLDAGQTVEVTVPALPGRTYTARIKSIDRKFLDPNRNDQTHGLQVRATLSENLSRVEGVKLWRPFDGFYAEGRVFVNAPDVLAVPRSAVLEAGPQPLVYVDEGSGHYQRREVKLGRAGDEFVEILGGLTAGEKVVTTGNLLIDSEAQFAGQ